MQVRMKNPATIIGDAMGPLVALGKTLAFSTIPEAITRLAYRTDRVPYAIWAEAARHYDETALAWLVLDVSVVNLYNRLNVATRQIAGAQQW